MAALDWLSKNYPNFRIPVPGTKSGISVKKAEQLDQAFTRGARTAMRWAVNQWKNSRKSGNVNRMGIGKKRKIRSAWYDPYDLTKSKKSKSQGTKRPAKTSTRVGRFHTFGRSGPKFGKARKVRDNKFIKKGAVIKLEDGGTQDGSECVYVGHYSLPIIFLWRSCMMALARRIFNALNIHVQDPQEDIKWSKALSLQCYYRDSLLGEVKAGTVHACPTLGTLMDFQDDIAQAIVTDWAATDTYYEIVEFFVYDATGEVQFRCLGSNIIFEVVGNSHLQLQNRTLANDTVGDEQARSALDITNNPLRGKRYDGYGNLHPMKFNNITTAGSIPQFNYSNDYGLLALDPESATNYSDQVKEMLHKPPLKGALGGVNKSKYVMLAPGEIRRSTCRGYLKENLNQMLKRYSDAYRGKTNFNSPADCFIKKGASSFYGFEKLCDVRDAAKESGSISIGYEINTTISAIAYVKKHTSMNPLQTITHS